MVPVLSEEPPSDGNLEDSREGAKTQRFERNKVNRRGREGRREKKEAIRNRLCANSDFSRASEGGWLTETQRHGDFDSLSVSPWLCENQ